MSTNIDQNFVRQMQKKVEQELAKKEKEVVEYWREELNKVIKKRHQDLAGLTSALQDLLKRMDKRISVVR